MTLTRVLRAWLIILPAMIANGVVRELVIERFVGALAAEILSVTLGIAIIVVMTRYLLRPLAGRPVPEMVRASVTLVALTVAFEFLFGRYVDGKTWAELFANYELWNGRLWPVALAALAFMPFLWGRWALPEPRHAG
ncbi:MAG: hypothetical protein WD801_00860 [Gemmatimonadaceae bacterium]